MELIKKMIFGDKIKETNHISCLNGKETTIKKMIIKRELSEQFNIIKDVYNAFADVSDDAGAGKMDNAMLFKIMFFDLLNELSLVSDEQAISILEIKARKVAELEKQYIGV